MQIKVELELLYTNTRKIATEYRLSHWSHVMRERRESGLSIKAFCKEAGFHENVYYYWPRKLREAACEQMPDLQAETGQTGLAVSAFTEVYLAELPPQPALPKTPGHLRIEVGGMLITTESGYPPSMLAALTKGCIAMTTTINDKIPTGIFESRRACCLECRFLICAFHQLERLLRLNATAQLELVHRL